MSSIVRILVGTRWPMVFVVFYLGLFCVFVFRDRKKHDDLILMLKENGSTPEKCISKIEKFIKSNPFSHANSTLRVFAIQLMVITNQKQNLQLYVKKIRPIDVYDNASDQFLYSIFLLKEYGYKIEYETLKKKSEVNYKPFNNHFFKTLIQPNVDMKTISFDESANISAQIKGIISYYRGIEHYRNKDFQSSEKEFNISQQYIPNINHLLKLKGYIQ